MEKYLIGSHIAKCPTYLKSLKDAYKYTICDDELHNHNETENSEEIERQFWEKNPIQLFTGTNKGWKTKTPKESDVEKTKVYINEYNIRAFIHTCYLINLSRTGEKYEKGRERMVADLKIGSMLGFKGVVVHVGKAVEKLTEEVGIINMYNNILNILPEIDENCPLLVETPASQGTEICTKIETFMDFYEMFTEEERRKVRICVDTCHVWASGYEPMEYLTRWYEKYPESIVLVHWNDSKQEKGSKKDRHAPAGEGYIGWDKMEEMAIWCTEKDIPMVIE